MDIIDKLNAREYKVKGKSHKTDNIRLTMDKATLAGFVRESFSPEGDFGLQTQRHQFSFSLAKKFKAKAVISINRRVSTLSVLLRRRFSKGTLFV